VKANQILTIKEGSGIVAVVEPKSQLLRGSGVEPSSISVISTA